MLVKLKITIIIIKSVTTYKSIFWNQLIYLVDLSHFTSFSNYTLPGNTKMTHKCFCTCHQNQAKKLSLPSYKNNSMILTKTQILQAFISKLLDLTEDKKMLPSYRCK